MRYVVGYVNSHRGHDAINLAATLAGSRDAELDIVIVLPVPGPSFDMYSPDRAFDSALADQAEEWLAQALTQVPDGVRATTRLVYAESITEGLIEASVDPKRGDEAGLIVIGASRHGIFGRFTVGSIAGSLLHSAPVPVALATAEYEAHPAITQITCATGTRQGAEALLDVAIGMAAARMVPLRLMSLVALDAPGENDAERVSAAEEHVSRLVATAEEALGGQAIGGQTGVTGVVGTGKSLEEAVASLPFEPSDIVLVGSSRLAERHRIFIGTSASRMLRALTVPMIVVPRDYPTTPPTTERNAAP